MTLNKGHFTQTKVIGKTRPLHYIAHLQFLSYVLAPTQSPDVIYYMEMLAYLFDIVSLWFIQELVLLELF